MAMHKTGIPYLDLHWPIATGCVPDRPCWARCWARGMAHRFHRDFTPTFHPEMLDAPLRSRAPAGTVVGVAFGGDITLTRTDEIRAVVGVCCARRDLTFVLLTKRPERLAAALTGLWNDAAEACVTEAERFLLRPVRGLGAFPPENVYLGFSAWDQNSFDFGCKAMAPLAAKRWRVWCSMEPMLGPVDPFGSMERLTEDDEPGETTHFLHWTKCGGFCDFGCGGQMTRNLAGIILGGESGPGARPMQYDWVRVVRDACARDNVPFFFKQPDAAPLSKGWVHASAQVGHKTIAAPALDGQIHVQTPWAEVPR